MAESKSPECQVSLESISLLAGANLLFFCLEFVLAVEVRSVSLFADSIVFLEIAAVSVLSAPHINWGVSGREAFGRFTRTMILIPTCFMFWMIAANYYTADTPSAVPLAATGAVLLLTNIACLVVLNCVAGRHGCSRYPLYERGRSRACLACCKASDSRRVTDCNRSRTAPQAIDPCSVGAIR